MIDIYFIEFYINRVYNKKLEEYFGVVSSVTSGWRHGKFPEIYKLSHYTNFQPLWMIDNCSKGNRYIG